MSGDAARSAQKSASRAPNHVARARRRTLPWQHGRLKRCNQVKRQRCNENPSHQRTAHQHIQIALSCTGGLPRARLARQLREMKVKDAQPAIRIGQRTILALPHADSSRFDITRRAPCTSPRYWRLRLIALGPATQQPALKAAPFDFRRAIASSLDFLHRFGQKGHGQKVGCLGARNPARAQVKQRRFINRPGGGTMRAGHIIRIDLKLGLGQELRCPRPSSKRLADLIAIGLLRAFLAPGSCPGNTPTSRRCAAPS